MNSIKRTLGFIFSHPLAKKHPVKALFRFFTWQLQYRLTSSKFIKKPFLDNVNFFAAKGLTGITGNIYTGLHEFDDMAFLLHLLRSKDLFYDIGANVGSYALLASGVCKANSIAIEPIQSTFNILTKNIELNELQSKVKLINSAVGAKPGTLNFSSDDDTTNHVIADDEVSATQIVSMPVITIDSLLSDKKPALIKIDVEGFETKVLKGMHATLNATELKAIIIELKGNAGRYGFSDEDIHQLLLSKDFAAYSYNAYTRLLSPLEIYGAFNTIYCRDLEFINSRLKSAPKIMVMGEWI